MISESLNYFCVQKYCEPNIKEKNRKNLRPPPQKCSVPTNRSSLKLSIQTLGEPQGDLNHTHLFAARSHYLESKK